MSSSSMRHRDVERDGAMKMTDGSTNGTAVIRSTTEEGELREKRDNADS